MITPIVLDIELEDTGQWERVLFFTSDGTRADVTGWTSQLMVRELPQSTTPLITSAGTPYTFPGDAFPSGFFHIITATQAATLRLLDLAWWDAVVTVSGAPFPYIKTSRVSVVHGVTR